MSLRDSPPVGLKVRAYGILEGINPRDRTTQLFQLLMLTLIMLNIAAMVIETVKPIYEAHEHFFDLFETVSVVIFSLEYVARLWACTSSRKYAHPVWGRLRFALTPLAIIDLLAVLPFYMPLLHVDLRFVRGVRLVRLLRLLKLARYSQALQLFGRVLAACKKELLSTFFILLVYLLVSSSLMYYVEHEAQPDKFGSVPAAFWWGIATVTTAGGDVYPITPAGKALGGIFALIGIVVIALPTAIIVAAFLQETARERMCPHCGKPLVEALGGDGFTGSKSAAISSQSHE
jgi:voltage-gated potassium channel